MQKIKRHPVFLALIIILCGIGISLLFINPNSFIKVIYIFVGIILIAMGLFKILNYHNEQSLLIFGALNILEGLLFMFYHNFIVTIIIGLAFVAAPIYEIIKSNNKKETALKALPSFLIALVLIFSGDFFVNIFVKVLGALAIILALYYLFIFIFYVDKEKKVIKRGDVIDVEAEVRERE